MGDLKKPVVYFAHSMQIYGTEEAARAKAAIERLVDDHDILDPETIPWKELAKQHGWPAIYESVIRQSARVVAYEHLNHVGRGVAEEVGRAFNHKRPVHVLRGLDAEPVLIPVKRLLIINRGDWKIRYGRLMT